MIFEKLSELISEQFGVEPDTITMETTFEDDLGADSLDIVELSMALEEEFGVSEMGEDEISSITTVGDLVHYLQNKLERPRQGGASLFACEGGEKRMKQLEERLGYLFHDRSLLENALTHSSYANENKQKGEASNERLEFLGDSVLGMVVADHLFRSHPDMPEGELTRTRAALVCEESLVEVARKLELGQYLKLGRGEDAGGGRKRPSIQADAVEAVIAAVYLDGGIGSARKFITSFILTNNEREQEGGIRDYKTALQELVQRESGQVLSYRLTGESGPDHAKVFRVEVDLNGTPAGKGEGRSKKEAEQSAAKAAIAHLTGAAADG